MHLQVAMLLFVRRLSVWLAWQDPFCHFGFTVIMDRLIELSDAIEPSIEKSNMSDDIVWYKDMLRIYGLEVNTRYEKYKKYD